MRMKNAVCLLVIVLLPAAMGPGVSFGGGFSGGGVSLYAGTGSPNSIDAASALAQDLDLDDETGNYMAGFLGFYQGDRYRIGAAFQAHGWGGVSTGKQEADDGAAGVVAAVAGLYGTYTMRHDRVLLNAGGIVGAGRCLIGFSEGDGGPKDDEHVATFYVEPLVSAGVAAARWFAVEFQLSAPIFILTEDLDFTHEGETYSVDSSDMAGVTFAIKLTFGSLADF